jgi:hypothetical protein
MQPGNVGRLLICVAVVLSITSCSGDPKPGTPEAAAVGDRYMRSMSDTLARSRSFTFETSEQIEVLKTSGQKGALSFTRKVTVRRPNGLFFDFQGKGDTAFDLAAYYDGQTLTLSEKPGGDWAQTTVPSTLDELLDDVMWRFGLPVPIGDVVYSSPYDAFIGSNARGGLVARETIDGVPCVKLDYADDLVDVRLWLPTSGPTLPRKIELVYKKRGPTQLISQLNFTNWKLDVPVTDAMFTFQPPANHGQVEFRDLVDELDSRILPSDRQGPSTATPGAKPVSGPAAR